MVIDMPIPPKCSKFCAIFPFLPVDTSTVVDAAEFSRLRIPINEETVLFETFPGSIYPPGWRYEIDPQMSEQEWLVSWETLVKTRALFGSGSLKPSAIPSAIWVNPGISYPVVPEDLDAPEYQGVSAKLLVPSMREQILGYAFRDRQNPAGPTMKALVEEFMDLIHTAGGLYREVFVPLSPNFFTRFAPEVDGDFVLPEEMGALFSSEIIPDALGSGRCNMYFQDFEGTYFPYPGFVQLGYYPGRVSVASSARCMSVQGGASAAPILSLLDVAAMVSGAQYSNIFSGFSSQWMKPLNEKGVASGTGQLLFQGVPDPALQMAGGLTSLTWQGEDPDPLLALPADAMMLQIFREGKLPIGIGPNPLFGGAPLPLVFPLASAKGYTIGDGELSYIKSECTLRIPFATRSCSQASADYEAFIEFGDLFEALDPVAPGSAQLGATSAISVGWTAYTTHSRGYYENGGFPLAEANASYSGPLSWAAYSGGAPQIFTLAQLVCSSGDPQEDLSAAIQELEFRTRLGVFRRLTLYIPMSVATVSSGESYSANFSAQQAGYEEEWEQTGGYSGGSGATAAQIATKFDDALAFTGAGRPPQAISSIVGQCVDASRQLTIYDGEAVCRLNAIQIQGLSGNTVQLLELKSFDITAPEDWTTEISEASLVDLLLTAIDIETRTQSLGAALIKTWDSTRSGFPEPYEGPKPDPKTSESHTRSASVGFTLLFGHLVVKIEHAFTDPPA